MFGACACASTKSACRSDLAPLRFTGANCCPRSQARFACSATLVNPCSRSRFRTLRWRRVSPWFTLNGSPQRIVRGASLATIVQGHGAGLSQATSRAVGEPRSPREQCGGVLAHAQAQLGNPRVSPSAAALDDEKLHLCQPRCSQFSIFETSLVTHRGDRGSSQSDTGLEFNVVCPSSSRFIDSTRSSAPQRKHCAVQPPHCQDD